MNVILVNQFYPPDQAPTGTVLHDVARTLVNRGHHVQVIASNRAYNARATYLLRETRDAVSVVRVRATGFGRRTAPGRLLDYCSFVVMCAMQLLLQRPKPDLVVSMTTPPFLGVIVKCVAALRNSRHAHWVMDLYPDVMVAHGMIAQGGIASRMMAALTRFSLKGSAGVLAIGPDMAGRLSTYTASPIDTVPLWGRASQFAPPDTDAITSYRAAHGWQREDIVFMYSGNMGLGHRLNEFLSMAEKTSERADIRWVFCGDGSRRTEVAHFIALHPDAHIELLPYAEADRLHTHLAAADVHLVSLDASWAGCMVPSKLQGAFASGRPVIFIGDPDSSAGRWIQDGPAGWVVPQGDAATLLDAVNAACAPAERQLRGQNAIAYAREHFEVTTNTKHITARLESYLS